MANTKASRKQGLSWSTPRMWSGMTAGVWRRFLADNRFAVRPARWPMALVVSCFSVSNSISRLLSEAIYRRKAEAQQLAQPPLFVIGHWRSGTTLLHELLVLDQQFGYPNTCQCTTPAHFLLTQRPVTWFFGLLMPKSRPMDNMAFGPERPQEDEIALCNLGAASPYRLWGFHDLRATPPESLELEGLPAAELERWKRMMLFFVKRLALHDARRIVLKSPTHTARIKTLLELFPDAQFVHIRRDPYKVFVSTVRTWTGLCDFLGLGRFRDEAIEEQVFASFVRMYRCFFRDRELLRPGQFHEVSYEELVADPCGVVQGIYEKLKLGDFESVRPKLKKFFDDAQDYRTNEYRLSPELRTKITDRWGEYIDALGYQREPIGT